MKTSRVHPWESQSGTFLICYSELFPLVSLKPLSPAPEVSCPGESDLNLSPLVSRILRSIPARLLIHKPSGSSCLPFSDDSPDNDLFSDLSNESIFFIWMEFFASQRTRIPTIISVHYFVSTVGKKSFPARSFHLMTRTTCSSNMYLT